jgi:hypothetical protein
MTGEERKKRGEKSAAIVEQLVRVQLHAMGCERFDIGIRRDAGEMILRERQDDVHIEEAIKWLRHENARALHIYIRPAGAHSLSLLDDLSWETTKRMKAEGYEPAAVVGDLAQQLSGLAAHGQVLDAATSTRAPKQLAERFGGDPSSADWWHFGRLAGFTNPKPERQLPSGMQPFAWLRSATRRTYSKAAAFVAAIRSSNAGQERQSGEPPKRHAGMLGAVRLDRWKNSTPLRPMPGIFTAQTWHGRNTLPAVA